MPKKPSSATRGQRQGFVLATSTETAEADSDVATAKFQPFVQQTDVQQAFLQYKYKAEASAGTISIFPMTEQDLAPTTELLTQSFAESMGYFSIYRKFLRRHIQQYLQKHMYMPPKSIVLVASLKPADKGAPAPAIKADTEQRLQRTQGEPLTELPTSLEDSVQTNLDELTERIISARMQNNSSMEDDAERDYRMATLPLQQHQRWKRPESAQPMFNREESSPGQVVGTVEVSLVPSTRTRYLTLNAPEECAYVCNMAVDPDHRRQGYGLLLLEAVEEIARLGGQRDLYLHLRMQDAPAQALYKRGGYREANRDNPLVFLLGQDRRYLMHKRLAPILTPGSA
ncbi:g10471 [Coccomyxa viridis]|uniref:G10471 protein n=1 Tax=Coccomyxa viridis TaxID=1274662 RepID=A0ABP1G849_9CHLO